MSNKKSIEASTEGERNTERALKQALEEKYGKSIEASTGERNTERALKKALKETEIQRELETKHTEKKEHGARGKLLLGCTAYVYIYSHFSIHVYLHPGFSTFCSNYMQ